MTPSSVPSPYMEKRKHIEFQWPPLIITMVKKALRNENENCSCILWGAILENYQERSRFLGAFFPRFERKGLYDSSI